MVIFLIAFYLLFFQDYMLAASTEQTILSCILAMFVSDFRQVGGFLQVLRFPPPIKLTATI
jgi:hypothetical protein